MGGNPNFKIKKNIFAGGRRTGVGEGDLYWTPVTLTYNLRERKNVSNGTCPPQGQQLCKIIWNPCINVQVMARRSSIYDHFDLYLTPVTLTFNVPEKNVSDGTFPPQGQQLCKILFESHAQMYK